MDALEPNVDRPQDRLAPGLIDLAKFQFATSTPRSGIDWILRWAGEHIVGREPEEVNKWLPQVRNSVPAHDRRRPRRQPSGRIHARQHHMRRFHVHRVRQERPRCCASASRASSEGGSSFSARRNEERRGPAPVRRLTHSRWMEEYAACESPIYADLVVQSCSVRLAGTWTWSH